MKTKKKRSDVTNQQIDSTIPCVGSIFLATDGVKMWLELRRGTRGADLVCDRRSYHISRSSENDES